MRTFQCTHCQSLVFFDDSLCVQCGHALGFDPQAMAMRAVAPGESLRFCRNHADHRACNFLVTPGDPDDYCVSCRQTRVIPNLSTPGNLRHWITIEKAKRRLYYTLARLGLEEGVHDGAGVETPAYEFLEDVPGDPPVMTGHANGLITVNIAEADDAERARRRLDLHEPYRTLLGHLRHEVGHFYWDKFFRNDPEALDRFRQVFGDETADYSQALQRHYEAGPPPDWQSAYVSSYATMHPWEDWAETWAHYLHLVDLLETAADYRLAFTFKGPAGPTVFQCQDPYAAFGTGDGDILTALLNQGMGVSLMLNSLNRSLGHDDAYPFALSTPVLAKLRFVHDVVRSKGTRPREPGTPGTGQA